MRTDERVQRLRAQLRLPLIAAPMFLVSGPDLVLAACRAGVCGALPAPNARTLAGLAEWLELIARRHADSAAGGRPVAPWALNLVTHRTYERLEGELALVERFRPPVVITALGSPTPVVERVHAYGGLVIADVNSVELARKAAAAGVDGLALVCAGAGGHTGRISPFAFVPAVRRFFDGLVVVGGSIGTGGAIRAVELLGADLVYVGTPFIAASESLATDRYRDMVVRARLEDLVLTKAFTGADAYYLRESIVAAGLDPDALAGKTAVDWTGAERQLKAWKDIWSAGHGVECVTRVEPVAQLVERLAAEYARARQSPEPGEREQRTSSDPSPDALVGGWRLVRWEIAHADGTTHEPYGADPLGLLTYCADGSMSACIAASDRPRLPGEVPRQASAEARARAFDGYFSYAGRWSLAGGRVMHDVDVALNPAMVGTRQVRDVHLRGDRLELSATEAGPRGARTHRLTWARRRTGDA